MAVRAGLREAARVTAMVAAPQAAVEAVLIIRLPHVAALGRVAAREEAAAAMLPAPMRPAPIRLARRLGWQLVAPVREETDPIRMAVPAPWGA